MSGIIDETYEIIEQLGSGGGGDIFLARHKRLNKQVVLKVDRRKLTTKPEILRREVDVLKNLHHAFIPQVYDFVNENGRVTTVMDYIGGESLDRPLARGETFPQAQVIKWAREILDALCYLHEPVHGEQHKGYVHSDIKPANIMRLPNGDICLIDFNIALAIGEYSFIGLSSGYASPEHYGLDYTDPDNLPDLSAFKPGAPGQDEHTLDAHTTVLSNSAIADVLNAGRLTVDAANYTPPGDTRPSEAAPDNTPPEEPHGSKGAPADSKSSSKTGKGRKVMPDVRSDIFSLGATLYHLLSGQRPPQNAVDVVPLSPERFSRPLVDIITKAMRPNPNERFQTAAEMLAAFDSIRENDPRTVRLKKTRRISAAACAAVLAAGLAVTAVGSRRLHNTSQALLNAEQSRTALSQGDVRQAVQLALAGLPDISPLTNPAYRAEPREALTEALGVYDLSDSYKSTAVVSLPSAPLTLRLSEDGRTGACMCSSRLVIFSAENGSVTDELDTDPASVSEVEFIDSERLVYAGAAGLTCYDTASHSVLWTGAPATAIAVSGDGKRVLAIYKEEPSAALYDADTGEALIPKMNFGGEHQSADGALNLDRHLLELNEDGSAMAVSFDSGKVLIADLNTGSSFTSAPDFSCDYFFGGFAGSLFAASFTQDSKSNIDIIDCPGTFASGSVSQPVPAIALRDGGAVVKTRGDGIYVSQKDAVARLDPSTGDMDILARADGTVYAFDTDGSHIVFSDDKNVTVCTVNGAPLGSFTGYSARGLCSVRNGCAVYGNRDDRELKILRFETDSENTAALLPTDFPHTYAKLTADGENAVMYSADGFRTVSADGSTLCEGTFRDREDIYDMQFVREAGTQRIEILYKDGSVVSYDPLTGEVTAERQEEAPPPAAERVVEFSSDRYRFEAPFSGDIAVYDTSGGKKLRSLTQDGYLTDMWFADEYSVMHFVRVGSDSLSESFGVILDNDLNEIARVPGLSDLLNGELIIELPSGSLKKSKIYSVSELIELGNNKLEEST